VAITKVASITNDDKTTIEAKRPARVIISTSFPDDQIPESQEKSHFQQAPFSAMALAARGGPAAAIVCGMNLKSQIAHEQPG
jgi:hypothetical protein